MELQRVKSSQDVFEEKQDGEFSIIIYCKSIVIRTVWFWQKQTKDTE